MSLEQIKASSGLLRGSIGEELDDGGDQFAKDTTQLLKFHGIYQQDDRDVRRERGRLGLGKDFSCMVRASIPGGALTGEQYLVMDRLADAVGNGTLRITTRQGLQYHFVRKGDLRGLVRALNDELVTTLAACGDVARNVMGCPAPLRDRVSAQVTASAIELGRHLRPQTQAYWQLWVDGERAASLVAEDGDGTDEPLYGPTYLPRKFKVGFAFPGDNCVDAYTHDIGIVPSVAGGEVVGYTLIVGGGLGMSHNKPSTYPRLGDPVGVVAPRDLIATVKAVIGIQRDHGDREDRKHARMKYLVAEWGIDAFRTELERRLGWPLARPGPLAWPHTSDHLGWHGQGDGRAFLGLAIPSGRIQDNGAGYRSAIREAVEQFGSNVRLTPRQDLLLTDVAEADRSGVEELVRAHGVPLAERLAPSVRAAMACPALPTCGLALTEAERVMPVLIEGFQAELEQLGLGDEAIHLRMAGCPNGCSRPYSTEIGIVGRGKNHYNVFLGGDAHGTRLNTPFADRVAFNELLDVLRPVLTFYRVERLSGERFGDFCARIGPEVLRIRGQEMPQPVAG